MKLQKFELERLLQAKQYEMPPEAFWDDFHAKLQERLQAEQGSVRISWKQLWMALARRWTPAFVTCGLVLTCIMYGAFRSTPVRFVVSYQPSSVQNCHYSSFQQPLQVEAVKTILQKKKVASTAIHPFTF